MDFCIGQNEALKKLFKDLGRDNFKREHQHIVQWVLGELTDGYIDLGPDELVRGALVALRECVEGLVKQSPLGILIDDIDSGDFSITGDQPRNH